MLAWGLPEYLKQWAPGKKVLPIFAGILIPVLMILTWKQVGHWENGVKLFQHALEVTDNKFPSQSLSHNNLGIALFIKGKLKEGTTHFREAIRLKPAYADAHYNLARICELKGDEVSALRHMRRYRSLLEVDV